MLPWMFACNRVNYARYLPVYWLEMSALPTTHPDIHEEFMQGNFVVQRQGKHGFSGIACDQTIEQTFNRDTKTKGGMVGITRNKGAVDRWILSQPERACIVNQCFAMSGKDRNNISAKKDTGRTHILKEEKAIAALTDFVQSRINPFNHPSDDLVHIVSGMEVPNSIADDVMNAKQRGETALSEFFEKRLIGDAKKLCDPLPRLKLKSFSDVGVSVKSNVKGKQAAIKAERSLMARMVVIGSARGITIENLMEYSLGPIPLSIAYPDGGLMKTEKAKLMHFLEESIPSSNASSIPPQPTWIIDAMAVLQMLPHSEIPRTFGGLADLYLKNVTKIAQQNQLTVIHLVLDRYPDVSIKGAERERRGKHKGESKMVKIFSKEQKIPIQWKKFLACGKNKEQLPEFFFKCWSEGKEKLDYQLVLGHGEECHSLEYIDNSLVVKPVEELFCSHEEADTRLLLHAAYASKFCESVVIQSPDTDVLVIAISQAHTIEARLLFETGCGDKRRTLDVSAISQHLTESKAKALLGLHNFTGSDCISAFHGIGKKKPMAMLLGNDGENIAEVFGSLGQNFEMQDSIFPGVEKFLCALYMKIGRNIVKVNDARAALYKTGKKLEESIPPSLDCLRLHLTRANYQTAIQRRCLQQFPEVPSPDGHGWSLKDGELEIQWMTLPCAPKAVLEWNTCNCKKCHCTHENAIEMHRSLWMYGL